MSESEHECEGSEVHSCQAEGEVEDSAGAEAGEAEGGGQGREQQPAGVGPQEHHRGARACQVTPPRQPRVAWQQNLISIYLNQLEKLEAAKAA